MGCRVRSGYRPQILNLNLGEPAKVHVVASLQNEREGASGGGQGLGFVLGAERALLLEAWPTKMGLVTFQFFQFFFGVRPSRLQ